MEYFQLSANLPSLKDRFNKILRGKATSLATGFNILLLIPSGPLALFDLKFQSDTDYVRGTYNVR